jgi:hypothetical protein
MPVDVVHAASEYRVNVTLPVGATLVVFVNAAESPTVVSVPTVIDVGDACVTMLGDPGPTTISSLSSPHPVVNPLLFVSPPYEAIQ